MLKQPEKNKKVAQKQDRSLFLPDTLKFKELVHGHYNSPHGQGPKFFLSCLSALCDSGFKMVLGGTMEKEMFKKGIYFWFFFQKCLENC